MAGPGIIWVAAPIGDRVSQGYDHSGFLRCKHIDSGDKSSKVQSLIHRHPGTCGKVTARRQTAVVTIADVRARGGARFGKIQAQNYLAVGLDIQIDGIAEYWGSRRYR